MKDQTDRLEQLCKKLLMAKMEDMTQRELFEIILLLADRKTEPSLREDLLMRYDSHVDMLSDSPEHLCQIGNRGTILAGLAKLIQAVSPAFGSVAEEPESGKVRYSDRAADYCRANSEARIKTVCTRLAGRYYDAAREVFRLAFLDESNRVICEENVAYGNIGEVYIDFQLLFKKAMTRGATGILLAHSHPDGNLTPSSADIRVTERLKHACESLHMRFVDHIIVHCGKFRSIKLKDGECDTGEISADRDEEFESGTSQIAHSGVYRKTIPEKYDNMGYQFDAYEYSDTDWEYDRSIDPEDYAEYFSEQN